MPHESYSYRARVVVDVYFGAPDNDRARAAGRRFAEMMEDALADDGQVDGALARGVRIYAEPSHEARPSDMLRAAGLSLTAGAAEAVDQAYAEAE